MKTKRADFAAAFLRGRMVVAGGLGKTITTETNFCCLAFFFVNKASNVVCTLWF